MKESDCLLHRKQRGSDRPAGSGTYSSTAAAGAVVASGGLQAGSSKKLSIIVKEEVGEGGGVGLGDPGWGVTPPMSSARSALSSGGHTQRWGAGGYMGRGVDVLGRELAVVQKKRHGSFTFKQKDALEQGQARSVRPWPVQSFFVDGVKGAPGLLIAVILNLMLAVPFGLAFFPAEVPRAIGIQMFLFSTVVCQLVMTAGMMMVENIPFMHALASSAFAAQWQNAEAALATVAVEFALSSIVVGFAFYLLGHFKLGKVVDLFPRHIIVGCIGGVGVFIFITGLESATGVTFSWQPKSLLRLFTDLAVLKLWLSAFTLELLLRFLMRRFHLPLLPPFYFIAIPPLFYACLLLTGGTEADARAAGWLFARAEGVNGGLVFTAFKFELVSWITVFRSIPTMLALTAFSLMHVPINVPSLSQSTGIDTDVNEELKAHGLSNLLSGCLGGTQNYLCYSNSLLYHRCGGGGKISGLALACLTGVFYFIGPAAVSYVPRVMAGCLLLHVGMDLCKEALVDSFTMFDRIEYSSVVVLTAVMTAFGMTAGLVVGLILAAVGFTAQTGMHSEAIRGVMSAATLRSAWRRTPGAARILRANSQYVTVVQLQNILFFGNATSLVQRLWALAEQYADTRVWLLDFTLVSSIDSSAAESIAKMASQMTEKGLRLCFARGSSLGFPCDMRLSERLNDVGLKRGEAKADAARKGKTSSKVGKGETAAEKKKQKQKRPSEDLQQRLCVADDLDGALAWCESLVISDQVPDYDPRECAAAQSLSPVAMLHEMCPLEKMETVAALLDAFETRQVLQDVILWRQGDDADSCLLLVKGQLISVLEQEAGSTETVRQGMLVGEFGLLNRGSRLTTLISKRPSTYLALTRSKLAELESRRPELALVLARICMNYLGLRTMHVCNRIWESRCVPI